MSEELLGACKYGDLNQVKNFLTDTTNSIDIYYKYQDGYNALISAALNGHLNIVKYLLSSTKLKDHANIHAQDIHCENPLMISGACGYGRLKNVVRYLICNHNMEIDKKTMDWFIRNDKQEELNLIKIDYLYKKLDNQLDIKKPSKQRKI